MFSVPYNQDINVIEVYKKYKDIISEVYFPSSPMVIHNSRKIEWDEESEANNIKLLEFLNENNIESEMIMNSICDSRIFEKESLASIINYLYQYSKLGLKRVSVSNPILFKAIVDNIPDLKPCLSILSNLTNINQIKQYYDYGAVEVCLHPYLSRDKDLILKMKEIMPGLKIKMMANCFCTSDCIAFTHHHIEVGNANYYSDQQYFDYVCVQDKVNPLKKNFILPNEVDYYDYIDIFKISGRQLPTADLEFILDKYLNKKNYGYNLIKLLDGPRRNKLINISYIYDVRNLDQISNCKYKCLENNCNYCDTILDKYFYFEGNE